MTEGVTIVQKYLERGHTQMECDSAHSVIERRKKSRSIYTPAQYARLIEEARVSKPYKVHYINHEFYMNYSELRYYPSIRPGNKVGNPQVVNIRALQYSQSGGIQYKLTRSTACEPLHGPGAQNRTILMQQ